MKKSKGVAILIILVLILGALGAYSGIILSSTGAGKNRNIKLGLDLAGGVSITYQAVGDTPTAKEMNDTIYKLQQRIENDLGSESATTEANVYQVGDDRISVEIPGVTDANAILEELGTPGALYFIKQTDDKGQENYSFDSSAGEYKLNFDLKDLEKNGSVVLSGSEVNSAEAVYQSDQTTKNKIPVVSISLNKKGTQAFADATTKAYQNDESIGIYYDGHFVSVPHVNSAITDGNCIIEGMGDFEEAESLASYIRIGGLDVELEEIQSEIVGAQLGNDALRTSLIAGAIGLCIVMVFLIFMYLLPGFASAIALLLYTEMIISILYLFDITLTLPGIAGIILSIGMAVDANVIIFARVREELAAGKNVFAAVDEGFSKAMSAIVDGNVTTLIAAAVLGVLGSGTVRGFASTLALGVVLSMFTALAVTRLIMHSFLAIGLTDEKMYGKAKMREKIPFMSKRKIFFALSICLIGIGIACMGINAAGGKKALNYSLEFLGGTSTTVTLDKDYSIAELDQKLVPVVSKVTGDNDIQVQKISGGNQVIVKTRTLELEEREAFNTAMEETFGSKEEEISSENISSMISGEMRREAVIAVLVASFFMLLYIWFRFKDIRFASAAIIALLHDVLVVLALYAVLRLSVGSAFIACMLTVIGYSVNDTIVIFDRIRENMAAMRNRTDDKELEEVADASITQTLSRSLSTSFTTAITIFMILILGVTTIKEFALPLLAGVITGTYSSICIATELWFLMRIRFKSKKEVEMENRKNRGRTKRQKANKENNGVLV
ncbi:MAG: protein translocase subunit SecD [Lachnospiraceae bacterium]|nr:protein translocase subunit SecD [Lachnospiraceae bacterium]